MNLQYSSNRFITWLDIERKLKKETNLWSQLPQGIHSINCYHHGMEIIHSNSKQDVVNWLEKIFGKTFLKSELQLILLAGKGSYSIEFELIEPQEKINLPQYPLWNEMVYLPTDVTDPVVSIVKECHQDSSLPAAFKTGPNIISFHSFKGGVGRTTALMTFVTARLEEQNNGRPVKVLVVDADLEAPGVTFWLDEINQPQVSFVQFLEAMHYPPVNQEASLRFFADELKKSSINLEGSQHELFILPAALNWSELMDMPIHPSHLASNPDNPWVLTDHLHALGKYLGVDTVFIDLRAGLSELSSPVIFDPRVEHYFVSTVAKQSVEGICKILERLHAFNQKLSIQERKDAKPSLVVSLLTSELKRLPDYSITKEKIEIAYPSGEGVLDDGVEWLEAEFSSDLMSIANVREAFTKLKKSNLFFTSAQPWAKNLVSNISTSSNLPQNHSALAGALYELCKNEYAEQNNSSDWLITDALRNLGRHFVNEIPNAVLIGAKGAGKTFTYLQIARLNKWSQYLEKVGELSNQSFTPNTAATANSTGVDSFIVPVLWSSNLQAGTKDAVVNARKIFLNGIGNKQDDLKQTELKTKLTQYLLKNDSNWDEIWEEIICLATVPHLKTFAELNAYLDHHQQSLVLLFDGIEDVFSDMKLLNQQVAIESLLKLVNRLSELSNQKLGALIFIRIDYVQAAIKQNVGQFMSRFNPFQLSWNPESFLRLAYWLCAKAKIINTPISLSQTLGLEKLLEALEPVWGHKLGKNESKEALSARWVYAALCDLRGVFQARDLVRFFYFAASEEKEKSSHNWTDRVLSPISLRQAIPQCSVQKVQEAVKEIAPIKTWYEKLAKVNPENKSIPFSASSVLLQAEELIVLCELGVIYEDLDPELGEKRLYLPEIYREGFGFSLKVGRPKVQALLKKNLNKLPF